MELKIPGRLWQFKDDGEGNEIGKFAEYKEDNEIYIDADHYYRLNEVYKKRMEHKWDNWIVYSGDEGDGKSTIAKQDCYIMAWLCHGKFNVMDIGWDPQKFASLIDNSNPGDSILYDEAITGMDSQRTMSEINHILKVKSTMCRKKRLFIAICIPSLFDLQKSIAVRRTFGMVKVYADEVKRGFFTYYNREEKRKLYILGKKYEDMDAWRGGPASRFLRWSFIDEKEYEKAKDLSQEILNKQESKFNRYKTQRDALVNLVKTEFGIDNVKLSELMKKYTPHPLSNQALSLINSPFKRQLLEMPSVSTPPTHEKYNKLPYPKGKVI